MNTNLLNIAALLTGWAKAMPASWRKVFYKSTKVLAGLATLALLVLPLVPSLGVTIPTPDRWAAILTGLLTFLGHLADSNTVVDQYTAYPAVDSQDPAATDPSTATPTA